MSSDELRDERRSLQQWEYDRRLKYFYQRPRPPAAGSEGGNGGGGDPPVDNNLANYARWVVATG